MDKYEKRRLALQRLANGFGRGGIAKVAQAIGKEPNYVSRMLYPSGKDGRKRIGEDSVEVLDEKFPGWLDDEGASFRSIEATAEDQSVFAQLDVQAICGNGRPAPDHPEVVSMMTMPVGMAQTLLGTTNRLGLVKIVSAANDSMTPTIEPDDLLFVDTSIVEYVSEGVYLLVHDQGLICKRLSRPGKDIIVSSDNPYYKSWKWNERPEQTRIVGRVLRALPIKFKKFSGN